MNIKYAISVSAGVTVRMLVLHLCIPR